MVTTNGNSDKANQGANLGGPVESSIEQAVMPAMTDINGTTTFTDSTKVQVQQYDSSYLSSTLLPVRDQTISDFLRKPQAIASGHWSATVPATTVLETMSVASYLDTVTEWKNKIEGFGLVRGTAVFRIVINANPFQQGKLILSFSPLSEDGPSDKLRYLTRTAFTQCPNVEVDCRDAAGIIEVPYISPTEYYIRTPEVGSEQFGWGIMRLLVLAPLEYGSGGDPSVDYTIYLHFEDFEMAAPTVAQAGGSAATKGRPTRSRVVAKSEAEEIASGKPLSSALMSASKVAGALSGIPAISTLAAPAAWMMRGMSGVASWFGWSKPLDDRPAMKVARLNLGGMPNSTGVSGATNLGLYHDTSLQVLDNMAGNDFDEMSFNYLKTRKALINSFTWNVTDGQDTTLFTQGIGATMGGDTVAMGNGVVSNVAQWHPPFSYVAQYFASWRGSIKITLKFVKTDFHSGRILVMFLPGKILTAPTTDASVLALREIIDVRSQSEVTLTFPYLLANQYNEVIRTSGVVIIRVLNELKAPSTVAQRVTVLMYASAGDDFELAMPGSRSVDLPLPLVPQIGGVEAGPDQTIIDQVVGGYSTGPVVVEPSAQCVGEMFTSIKQLLTRYTPLVTRTSVNSTTSSVSLYPYSIQLPTATYDPDSVFTQPLMTLDALSLFAFGYVLYRGRVRILDSPDTVNGNVAPILEVALSMKENSLGSPASQVLMTNTDYSEFFTAVADLAVGPSALTNDELPARQIFDPINGFEVAVPYYCRTRMSRTMISPFDQDVPRTLDSPVPYLKIQRKGTPVSTDHKLFRSCADDFQLAYFVGFPPIWYSRTEI